MRRRRNWVPRGLCGFSSQFEYKRCFKTPRSTLPWGRDDTSQKADGNMGYRI